MSTDRDPAAEFRAVVNRVARQSPSKWDRSRRLIEKDHYAATRDLLRRRFEECDLSPAVKASLHQAVTATSGRTQDLDSSLLKALTGLPAAKALRALCIYFDLVEHPSACWPLPTLSGEQIEQAVRRLQNPFDLLHESQVASVLDLGAGDLSFAEELVHSYGSSRHLILHSLDRLHPLSKLGGPLHPSKDRLRALQQNRSIDFAFFGNQDMFALDQLDEQGKLASRYTIATCWAPATPTFAYEPSRLSPVVIEQDLRRTKGAFHHTRFEGEAALEVHHGQRALLFPSWKFEIVGPLKLLSLLSARGALVVLGAVDSQVFWELLAQLVEPAQFRPRNQPFTPDNVPEIFGDLYQALQRLPLGESLDLAQLTALRLPKAELQADETVAQPPQFRYVQIRRGATFPGVPASSTARAFSSMSEETPPWFLTLVPT